MSDINYEFGELLLHIDNVSFTPEGSDSPILRNVTGAIYDIRQPDGPVRGQIVALLGPSGVGKTTLFRIMAGLLEPTSGQVVLNSQDHPVRPGQVGVVTQSYRVFDHRRVLGNLMVAGRQAGLSKKDSREKARELLARFGLTEHEGKFPKQLSGGQRQRVAIAQQLMCSERFLLMDEPFSGLDPVMKHRVCELIIEVSALHEDNTIVVVSHDIPAALSIADTVWLMGQDRDPNSGELVPGAVIIDQHNLVDMGIAWREDVERDPRFHDFVDELGERFRQIH